MVFRGPRPALQELLLPLLSLCEEASRAIVAAYADADPGSGTNGAGGAGATPGLLREKSDRSPLTLADLASHEILAVGLAGLTPDIPLLSEESPPEAVAGRRAWPVLWMVDPLDGTREFLERSGQFTINVALMRNGRPELGVIYEPLAECACVGIVGGRAGGEDKGGGGEGSGGEEAGAGAWRFRRDSGGDWIREPLATRGLTGPSLTVLSSHRHRNERLQAALAFLGERFALSRHNSGSALKFCDLAAGDGDIYPRFSPCSEWDVAAGDALVTAAGGAVWGLDQQPLRYNSRDTLLSPNFIAVGDPASGPWGELLEDLP
ncbi:MAG: inositol monophosphatase family protein [Halieaceae bacterium]|jgi:3'(2'), 5'-bisphosphate nucleotidase|nr:inositol monophosphatase family protein [Halieaceae bacterium]